MANRLQHATSPYLLQHADNPVDWWEWGPEAFAAAAQRDVPVLLSVGYASCHWCHVMAHESFEDAATARLMNEWFVNIKVDREERPDIDRVYMDALQTMTGHGGWPMTVFLTAEGEPFFAGTYFPPQDRGRHPSFATVLRAVHDAWDSRRSEVEAQAKSLRAAVSTPQPPGASLPGPSTLERAYESVRGAFDERHGGFGHAPKFPQAPTLEFLLRSSPRSWAPEAEAMLEATLRAMADGGIHDQIGGGFSRYSVDARWLVPHFEKMLYDNAQLAGVYARSSQLTGEPRFADVARSTYDYLLRELRLPDGGFASGEDADSEGEEGTFYVFSHDEFTAAGGTAAVAAVLGVTPGGNFDGRSILHRDRPSPEVAAEFDIDPLELDEQVKEVLTHLGELRSKRERPGLDDKVICAWNALAVRSFAEGAVALSEPSYLETAVSTVRFLLTELRDDSGRLLRSWRRGRISGPAFCDDYAALAVALFSLYRATGEAEWYREAERTTHSMIDLFWDEDDGGFFATGSDADSLIARPKNFFDSPAPSDNALGAEALQHLAAYTGDAGMYERLDEIYRLGGTLLNRNPLGAGHLLSVLLVSLSPPTELAIIGSAEQRRDFERIVRAAFRPEVFVAVGDGDVDHGIPLLTGRAAGDSGLAYVCHGFVCDAPISTPQGLIDAL